MAGYVFISNGTKPNQEKYESREPLKPSNVSCPCMEAALSHGYEVYYGVNRKNPRDIACEMPVIPFDAHTYRSITAFGDNKIAYKNLCRVIDEGNVEVIHCNTPVGGLVGRLAGRKKKVKKIIYTAHGFHFYKGAPLINRTLFKWAEKWMAHHTDAIITMNQEDYEAAKKFRLRKGGKVYFVHGVGINLCDYVGMSDKRTEKREELSLAEDQIMLISMGDLVARKNYVTAIEAVAKAKNPKLQYFICGKGPQLDELKALAESLGVSEQIHFLGFRTDIKELLSAADMFLFTTKQEGLPRSMMEAMASGLPCIASKIRGNIDLIEDGVGGYLRAATDSDGFAEAISKIAEDAELRIAMRESNLETIKGYDISVVKKEIADIYADVLKD